MPKFVPASPLEQRLHAITPVVYAVYLFCYFLYAASPTLTLTQHYLSGGVTSYNPLVGAIILTALSVGLHRLCQTFLPCRGIRYAISYFPPTAIAIALTAFVPHIRILPLAISGLLLIIWFITALYRPSDRTSRHTADGGDRLRPHLLLLLLTGILLGTMGNTDDITAYEVRTARYDHHGNYAAALHVGEKSLATSPRLFALRAYAMSHTPGGLGELLFTQPVPSDTLGAELLYLAPSDSATTLLRPDSLYRHLGLRPGTVTARRYFAVCAYRRPISPARDYYLCGLLLDKKLEKFHNEITRFYIVSDSVVLPRYYAEALVLYNRLHPDSLREYNSPNITANYIDFKEKEAGYRPGDERRNLLRREYGDTYWWYYFYSRK